MQWSIHGPDFIFTHFPQSLCSRKSWPRSVNKVLLLISALLADQSVILRSNITPQQLTVCVSNQERSPISGTGDSTSSLDRALEPSCLAPERDQLRDAGLPADVVQTILILGLLPLEKSYALRWHIFKSRCTTHRADPVHCQVVSVLKFLQEKLSWGRSPAFSESMWPPF